MSQISIQPHERLHRNMRLTQSNLTYLEFIRELERVETVNDALSKLIEVARPFFSKRTSKAVKKLNKKKRADEFAVQSTQAVKEVKDIEYCDKVT